MSNVRANPNETFKEDIGSLIEEQDKLKKKAKDKDTGFVEKIKTNIKLAQVNHKIAKSDIGKVY